jgi:xanthine dehydrogenase YagR molybdenum-binding subunit
VLIRSPFLGGGFGSILVEHHGVRLDTGTPGPMRAPGVASASAALEAAVDEAADACGIDPLEFRLVNYAETEPVTRKPFSSKALRECYAEGAKCYSARGPDADRRARSLIRLVLAGSRSDADSQP